METPLNIERTYAMIKPDAVAAGVAERILQQIESNGFTIVEQAKLQLPREMAEEFYAEHTGKPFFGGLVEFMSSGPIFALVLARVSAIREWRALAGPTNSNKAREEAPNNVRALYGTDGQRNAVHGSDSPASAAREIRFFFPNMIPEPILDGAAATDYIQEHLQPILTKALTALAKEKPSSDPNEAIIWLANWLKNNNPNAPQVVAQ